jgi:hypothetical protein
LRKIFLVKTKSAVIDSRQNTKCSSIFSQFNDFFFKFQQVFHFGDEDKSEESGSDGGQDDYKPDSDGNDEPDEEFIEGAASPSDSDDNSNNDENGYPLPLKKRKSGAAMTKEDIEAAKRAAFAAKPHIEVNAKKLRKKDYRDEIDTIIKAGEEDYQDFSDDELSQVLKV